MLFGLIFAALMTNEAFISNLFFSLTLSYLHGTISIQAKDLPSVREDLLTDFNSAIRESRVKREDELPDAKLELMLMLDPGISEFVDTNYAPIEFCRLFAEVQEVFDTFKDRRVTIELSAIYFEESEDGAHYIVDSIIDQNGALDIHRAISAIADTIQIWKQKYDAYLLLTRRRLVEINENTTTEYETGYSITGGACNRRNNIAVAKYSFKNIMHQITDLLGAVHAGDKPSATSTCIEGNYTYEVIGEMMRYHKAFSNCTEKQMKKFLKTTDASCLYADNISDNLDCDSIIPEIG